MLRSKLIRECHKRDTGFGCHCSKAEGAHSVVTTRLRSLKWIRFHLNLKSYHKSYSPSFEIYKPTEIDLTTINMSQTTPNSQKQVVQHTKAINLARRWSVQNENDLLQVRSILQGLRSVDRPSIRCLLFFVSMSIILTLAYITS